MATMMFEENVEMGFDRLEEELSEQAEEYLEKSDVKNIFE